MILPVLYCIFATANKVRGELVVRLDPLIFFMGMVLLHYRMLVLLLLAGFHEG